MTNKNHSYKKLMASAATAALVATAVAPAAVAADAKDFTDVNDRYADAVDYVVSKGVNGLTATQFGVQKNIKRVDAAVFIANALDLNKPGAPDSGFTDVPKRAQQAVNALKHAKIINGKTATRFGSDDLITRGEASLILQKAYDLKGDANKVKFTDVSNRYLGAVAGMLEEGVTVGVSDTKFGTQDPVKRGDLAVWLYKLKDHDTDVDGGGNATADGIKSVTAINDTTVEVEFSKAVDKDFIREAEKNGEYFRVFLQGDTAFSKDAIKSATITFSEDGKKAQFTLGETLDGDTVDGIKSGKKYTVALMDGDGKAADIIHSYGPTELKGSAAKPDFKVDAVADKIFVKFGEKMKSSALEVENYEVFDEGGQKIGDLSEFVKTEDDKGSWVDATKKTEVEFTLDPKADKKLLAGKKYKLHVKEDVKTDKNKTLSESDRTITVKTPSVKDAQPKAVTARVVDKETIVVVFDKDIDDEITVNKNQVEVKTSTGKIIPVDKAEKGDQENELKIKVDTTALDEDDEKIELSHDITYRVDLPANAVTNAVFPNASNDAVSKLKAEAQDNVEIKSVKAELKASAKNKKQADLYLTFDQRPNLDHFLTSLKDEEVEIQDGTDVYTFTDADGVKVKYVDDKTIVIEDVSKAFEFDGEEFRPEKGETYKLEIQAGGVKTDAFGNTDDSKTNQSKLKTTFGGVSVNAPAVDKVTLVSAGEIKIEFKEPISNVSEDDIYVAGVELYNNGNFGFPTLNGKDQLSASVSGSTLTLKAKGDAAFFTGFAQTNIEIKANAFTSKDSKVENDKIVIDEDNYEDFKPVDNAAPVMIGATTTGANDEIKLTFSESLEKHGDEDKIATLFSVKNAANNAVGSKIVDITDNTVTVEFNDVVFDEDTVMSKVEVTYNSGGAFYLKDEKGNKAGKATVKGVNGERPDGDTGTTKPEKPEKPEEKPEEKPGEGDLTLPTPIENFKGYNFVKDTISQVTLVNLKIDQLPEELKGKDLVITHEGISYEFEVNKYDENKNTLTATVKGVHEKPVVDKMEVSIEK